MNKNKKLLYIILTSLILTFINISFCMKRVLRAIPKIIKRHTSTNNFTRAHNQKKICLNQLLETPWKKRVLQKPNPIKKSFLDELDYNKLSFTEKIINKAEKYTTFLAEKTKLSSLVNKLETTKSPFKDYLCGTISFNTLKQSYTPKVLFQKTNRWIINKGKSKIYTSLSNIKNKVTRSKHKHKRLKDIGNNIIWSATKIRIKYKLVKNIIKSMPTIITTTVTGLYFNSKIKKLKNEIDELKQTKKDI